jgi:tetratricopeptide (TPR) repeat protein
MQFPFLEHAPLWFAMMVRYKMVRYNMYMFRSARFLLVTLSLAYCLSGLGIAQQEDTSQQQTQEQKDRSSARETELSSSKDTRIDLSPPADDAKKHPDSGVAVIYAEDTGGVQDFKAWDPHKAAKDIEIGDFYFKKKNYRAALDRYKEALIYKPNDAIANFRLGECEEKTGSPQEAVAYYEAYLKILPHGPLTPDAQKAVERLKNEGPPPLLH